MVRRVSAHVEIPRLDVGVGSKHSGASGELVSTVTAAVDDDFDTPAALAAIFEAATVVNQLVDAGDYSSAAELAGTIIALLKVLGVEVTLGNKHRVDDALIDAMVAERNRARARRDFDEADILREELAERSGVSSAYIWQIENGRRPNPSSEVAMKLAAALGVTAP